MNKKLFSRIQLAVAVIVILLSAAWFISELVNNLDWNVFEPLIALLAALSTVIFSLGANIITNFINRFAPTRVFLSYPSRFQKQATDLADSLRRKGIKVWLAAEQIKPGQSISASIESAITRSDKVIFLVTKDRSSHIEREIELAQKHKRPIIPVLLEETELPSHIQDIQYVDFRADREEHLTDLVNAVRA